MEFTELEKEKFDTLLSELYAELGDSLTEEDRSKLSFYIKQIDEKHCV